MEEENRRQESKVIMERKKLMDGEKNIINRCRGDAEMIK
jgi:hypothetical protein